jgi:hypothetical protein
MADAQSPVGTGRQVSAVLQCRAPSAQVSQVSHAIHVLIVVSYYTFSRCMRLRTSTCVRSPAPLCIPAIVCTLVSSKKHVPIVQRHVIRRMLNMYLQCKCERTIKVHGEPQANIVYTLSRQCTCER